MQCFHGADGESFVVGAYGDEEDGEYAGAAYIYKWNNTFWDEIKIIASDGNVNHWFGNRVSINANGEHFIIGACQDDNNDNGNGSGSVYLFRPDE